MVTAAQEMVRLRHSPDTRATQLAAALAAIKGGNYGGGEWKNGELAFDGEADSYKITNHKKQTIIKTQ